MKRIEKAVYAAAIGLILASWLGNYGYSRYYRLPESGFLRHYIETTEIPAVAFDLLYIANGDDKRKPINARSDELPALRFYPVQEWQKMSRQTIYKLMGYYDENALGEREAGEPLRLNKLTVYFSDGSMSEEDVGEIVVYRDLWPRDSAFDPPVEMKYGSSSSDSSGTVVVQAKRPARLEGVASAWLGKLGESFEYGLSESAERSLPSDGSAAPQSARPPIELGAGQSLRLEYRFRLSDSEKLTLPFYQLQLRESFIEPNGTEYDYVVFAKYEPHPTESEIRAYIRELRRDRS